MTRARATARSDVLGEDDVGPEAAVEPPAPEEAPGPTGPEVPPAPTTGDPAVDSALERLVAAAVGTPEDQVAAFDAAHRTLQDRLADVEG